MPGDGARLRDLLSAVFGQFTDRARTALVLAHEEACRLGHDVVGTEHLLVGLLDEGEGVAAVTLRNVGVSADAVRAVLARTAGAGGAAHGGSGSPSFTPRVRDAIDLARREAHGRDHHYIGTEDLLLGVAQLREGTAARILAGLGVDQSRVRSACLKILGPTDEPASSPADHDVEAGGHQVEVARRFVGELAAELVRVDADPSAVELAERVAPLLARLHALNGEALTRLVEMIRSWRGEIFLEAVVADDLVGSLLAAHRLGPGPFDAGDRFSVTEILQVMFWLHREGNASAVGPTSLVRLTGRSPEELREWLDVMAKQGLVEPDGDGYRLTEDGIKDATQLFDR